MNLRASTAAFAKDLDKISQLSFDSAKSIERSWNVIGTAITAAATAAVGALAVGIQKTTEWEVSMGHLADAAGTTVETMSGLSFVAKMMGVDIDNIAASMEHLDKQLVQAQLGSKQASRNVSLLGIDPATIKLSDDALIKLAEHFSTMPTGMQKTAEASMAFGKSFQGMLTILNLGPKGIQDFLDQAKAMGIYITADQVKQAEVFEQNITRMKESLHGLFVEITNFLIPSLNDMWAKFSDTKKTQGFLGAMGELMMAAGGAAPGQAYMKGGADLVATQDAMAKKVQETASAFAAQQKALEAQQKAVDALKKGIDGTITSLQMQIATFGMTATQVEAYKIQTQGAKLGLDAWATSEATMYTVLSNKYKLMQELATLDNAQINLEKLQFAADLLKSDQDDLAVLKAKADAVMVMANLPQPLALSPQLNKNFIDANQQLTTELQHSIAVWGMTASQVTLYNLSLLDNSAAAQEAARGTVLLQNQLKHIDDVTSAWKEFGQVADSALNDLIFSGKSFTQVLADITKQLGEMFLKWGLFGFGNSGFKTGEGLFGALASAIGLAGGGPVSAGTPYMVGEQGPELFVPATAGKIIPNGGAAGGVQVVYNIDARGSSITQEQFVRSLQVVENRAVQRALNTGKEMQLRT